MPSQYPYRTTIRNEFLGVQKVIRAMTRDELEWLVAEQFRKWHDQAERKREQKRKKVEREARTRTAEGMKSQAETDTTSALLQVQEFHSILTQSFGVNLQVDWDRQLDRAEYPAFVFDSPKPDGDAIRFQLLGPAPIQRRVKKPVLEAAMWWEQFLPFLRSRREARNDAIMAHHEQAVSEAEVEHQREVKRYKAGECRVVEAFNEAAVAYNSTRAAKKKLYLEQRAEFLSRQQAHNRTVQQHRHRYEQGKLDAVEWYFSTALGQSRYPDGIEGEPDPAYDEESRILVIDFSLPSPQDVPNVVEYRYVASRKAISPVEMKAKDFAKFYDEIIHQLCLRTMYEAFAADYAKVVQTIVFNGRVSGIDPKTGSPFRSCILSCQATREKFLELDLTRVTPAECVRGLKGIGASSLATLTPVKPILDLNRDDDRLVEGKAVASELLTGDNLAAMPWEDFEHLVRELFEREFAKSGGEVHVTQASRDRGVDAIAFDPDPIRGGKYVIQAKRYNVVVPPSAVRDLYGTMISEGAVKGILVTTSHFGSESREFAKDKPITLIDGSNLVYMFQKHGYDFTAVVLPKGDPRRGHGN
jgi:restriction system protein